MKKTISRTALFLSLLMIIALFSVSCGKEDSKDSKESSGQPVEKENTDTVKGISKAAYAGILGEGFGYNEYVSENDIFEDVSSSDSSYAQIQALSEWGVFENGGKFNPADETTLKFALESAVKAVGIDNIKKTDANLDENNLSDFYTKNIASIDVSDLDRIIDEQTAKEIVTYANRYSGKMTLGKVFDLDLAEGVKTDTNGITLNFDGYTGRLDNPDKFSVGDVIYFEPTDTSVAKAIKITEIRGNAFSYAEPSIEEIMENCQVSGTYDCQVIEAHSVSDAVSMSGGKKLYEDLINNVNNDGDYSAIQLKNPQVDFNCSGNSITCKVSLSGSKGNASGNASLELGIKNIKATVDYDYSWLNLKRADVKLNYDVFATAHVDGEFSKTIPLGEVTLSVAGPVNLNVKLTATIGANGQITVNYNLNTVASVGWKKGSGLSKKVTSEATSSFEAEATLTAEATLLLDLRLFDWSLANVQVTSGLAGYAKIDADLIKGEGTIDILLWVPLRWGVNQKSCLLTKISDKLKYSATIWDSKNSPFKWEYHKEFGKDGETTVVDEEIVDEDGNTIDEFHEFDFEPIEFDFIELPTYVMFLDEGTCQKITISHMPEDYTESDLVYESNDTSVCTVTSDGAVTAVSSGSTLVKVYTSDKTTAVWIAVTVSEDLSVDFNELVA